jgi:hypothetical protein
MSAFVGSGFADEKQVNVQQANRQKMLLFMGLGFDLGFLTKNMNWL